MSRCGMRRPRQNGSAAPFPSPAFSASRCSRRRVLAVESHRDAGGATRSERADERPSDTMTPRPPGQPGDQTMTGSLDAIFKAYDIRGVVPDELDETVARLVGNAFVGFTGAATVLVGRDVRPTSVPLAEAFIDGVTVAGADVVDLGVASTDLCY